MVSFEMNSPRYLNLFKIVLPLPGVSSILHRISAVAIFVLSLPMMGLLVFSLSSEANYEIILLLFENILFKSLFTLFVTAIFYHFISGLRHLVMDFGYWETLKAGRMSALATFISTGLFFFSFLYLAW
jgi:succinate dehydrogenase / fumarate reductase cytochrome b subunit